MTRLSMALVLTLTGLGTASAEPPQITLTRGLTAEVARVVEALEADPAFMQSIIDSNERHKDSTEEDLLVIDRGWRDDDAAVIDPVMTHPISRLLETIIAGTKGRVAEVIVMDAKGANVAVFPKTSDFYQGDEDKWQKTFPLGEGAEHAGDVEFDESTGVWAQQVSTTLMRDRQPVGAITVGFDIRYSSP